MEENKGNHKLPHDAPTLEYLDRLVATGRGVVPQMGHFSQAGALLSAGHARYESDLDAGAFARTIVPTEEGRALALVRAQDAAVRANPQMIAVSNDHRVRGYGGGGEGGSAEVRHWGQGPDRGDD